MFLATLLISLCQSVTPTSGTQLSPEEVLALAFQECKIERVVHYPNKKQKALAEKLAGEKISAKTVRAYRATRKGKLIGTGYFDAHKVRSKGQTLFIVVDTASKISRIEILRFDEPPEYKPKAKWLGQFKGMNLDKKLQIKQGICNMTGATLSARATTQSVRKVLAFHEIFYPLPKKKPKARPSKQTKKASAADGLKNESP